MSIHKLMIVGFVNFVLLFTGLWSSGIQAEENVLNIEYSAMSEVEWAYSTQLNDSQKMELLFEPEANIQFQDYSKFTSIVRFRVELEDKLEPGNPSQNEASAYSRNLLIGDKIDLDMREFSYEKESGSNYLKLGKQQIVWGKADGLKVLDVVNPQDFREFILDDFDNSRIPLWTVNTEIQINDSVLQLLWIPDQTYHALPEQNSLYAFTSPLLVPAIPDGVMVDIQQINKPDRIIADADYGMRISSFVGGWDVTFNYLYHYFDTPVLFQKLTLGMQPMVTVTPRYERSHLIGGTFSNAFGEFVLRGEIGYSTDRYFLTNNTNDKDGVIKSDETAYVLGLDWSGLTDTFISMQLFQSYLLDYQYGVVRDKVESTMTFLVQRNYFNDTVVVEFLWLHNVNNDDGLLRPKISYAWQDNINLWIGADVFYGDTKGLFGQFKKNDRFIVGFEWAI